ncbi:MAG: F0F1 ATP synthase subunit delta [Patescibacteria group bacterium]|jgi:F0F1-type ATP synthase delta subunit|nr:F0F1 ATP synthase subunit delta [Patescibacteria group bacterium]MDD5173146.1 F0F1 ATP synthase subunit delta [Patescibacteria group bacterium]
MRCSSQNLAKKLLKSIKTNPKKMNEIADQFILFCHQKNLDYLLPNILKYLEKKIAEEKEEKTLSIKIKNNLSSSMIEKIKKISGFNKNDKIKIIKDQKILGGFIAQYQNKIFDASVNHNLSLLKNKLINE